MDNNEILKISFNIVKFAYYKAYRDQKLRCGDGRGEFIEYGLGWMDF